jgi:hypothetical protein
MRISNANRALRRAGLVVGALVALAASSLATAQGATLQSPQQRMYPALPASLAHPGEALIAFKTPVSVVNNRFVENASGAADPTQITALNQTLTTLGTTSVAHLFTNVPADALNAARARAESATGQFVTDFTQVYLITYNPAVNSGAAANTLAQSPLLSSAMPDWKYTVPHSGSHMSKAQIKRALRASARARTAQAGSPSAAALPPNAAYRTDAQSYQDAASNDVTGAAAMIRSKFGQQPGQGEVVTNISLGNVNDQSTVLQNGQRYIVQAGYPKIPVWLSSQNCTTNADGTQTCTITLDPTGTTGDDQGDFLEVNLDFSVMAPPPLGDPRIVNPAPPGNGQLLGEAYGANYRLINPKVNGSDGFIAAFLGSVFLQTPKADVVTASIGDGFAIGGFSDYFFEQEPLIHDAVTTLVQGADTFVSISAGDGQTDTNVAMNPNGLTGPTNVTTDPNALVDINDPAAWANPNYSYALTVEPQVVIDSGANDAGADTLNDVFNNSPYNTEIPASVSHSQHTTETRWTGQQNFHTGFGSRVNTSAPGDDVLLLGQVEDANGNPINPALSTPRLIGGSSASAPEVAGAAAVVRQAARLLGQSLTPVQVRDLIDQTGRQNTPPAFDLSKANIGPQLDLTAAVQSLFKSAHANGTPSFARMTVAERKAALTPTDLRSAFWTDTTQDPVAGTATIDLTQGLVAPSSRTNETVGATGDNLFAPITFAVDPVFINNLNMTWTLKLGRTTVIVPRRLANANLPYVRLLPSEIFGMLGAPTTSPHDRVVTVTASSGQASISTAVTFKGQSTATTTHAVPPSFDPVFQAGDKVRITYDLRNLRDGHGGLADGGILLVSDIDRAVPQAFPDLNLDAHGQKFALHGLTGTITLTAANFPHGVGTYGLALRGTKNGLEIPDSTSFWQPIRFAPAAQQLPVTPKIQATASILNGTAPLFYDVADTEPGGSNQFAVTYDVRPVGGARNAIIEFSAPTLDFAKALFITGDFTADNSLVNNFTNPNGDRLDGGDDFGQPGETSHVAVTGTHGTAVLTGPQAGLSIPAANCDSTYQVRVLATDNRGQIVGVASNGSIFSYADFSKAVCAPTP